MIDPGMMRHRVTLEAPTSGQDSYGEDRASWSAEAELWAEVRPLSGRELEAAQKTWEQATHAVTVRHREGLTARKRFRYLGRLLEIAGVVADYAADQIVCTCVETR